ncbi:hypothetical protein ACFSTA_16915 [Ornithinibacillus salinisoli]|uniref:Uncharacterized protein n=1 Tax=Ornithinibacillus salinisoli TaxID=1848459 RepID=A0ABW4W0M8_9BACI
MGRRKEIPWLKHFAAIDKHLDKNEKWFQRPEKKMQDYEKDMDKWNDSFLSNMQTIEDWIKELEKKME